MSIDLENILAEFKRQYGHLSKYGLEVLGIVNLIDDFYVISVSTPFIFDRTKLPDKFMDLKIRDGIAEVELPKEFKNLDREKEYIWAYQRFEQYVDNNQELIRKTLNNPNMTRNHMLDALCFGDFQNHLEMCITMENEGKIPRWIK
jgi:hypothetical protein